MLNILNFLNMTLQGDIDWDNFRHLVFKSDNSDLLSMNVFIEEEIVRRANELKEQRGEI